MLTLFSLLKPAIFIWKQEVLEVKATETWIQGSPSNYYLNIKYDSLTGRKISYKKMK